MSSTVTDPDVSKPGEHDGPRRRWPAALAVLGVLAVLMGVLLIWNRGDDAPDAFPSGLGTFFSTVPIPVGDTWLAGVAVGLPDVTALDAEPVVTAGSAAAAMEVV